MQDLKWGYASCTQNKIQKDVIHLEKCQNFAIPVWEMGTWKIGGCSGTWNQILVTAPSTALKCSRIKDWELEYFVEGTFANAEEPTHWLWLRIGVSELYKHDVAGIPRRYEQEWLGVGLDVLKVCGPFQKIGTKNKIKRVPIFFRGKEVKN